MCAALMRETHANERADVSDSSFMRSLKNRLYKQFIQLSRATKVKARGNWMNAYRAETTLPTNIPVVRASALAETLVLRTLVLRTLVAGTTGVEVMATVGVASAIV